MGRKLNGEAILIEIWPIGALRLSRQKKTRMNELSMRVID